MKRNYFYSGLIALIVSLSSFGTLSYFSKDSKTIKVSHINSIPSSKAVYSIDEDGNTVPIDFHETAKNVLDGVVHIKSTNLYTRKHDVPQIKQYFNPFGDIFGDQFNKQYFFRNSNNSLLKKSPLNISSGSGVIISDDGFIVTNNHVIANADDIEVTLEDNRTYKATVVGNDPSTDLALLRIKESNLPIVPLSNSDDVKIGQWVMAVGNPMGLNSTVTAGIISAKGRNINILKDKYAVENFIQTDAAINPGNSGGALVNLNGGLVGINTAIASPTGSFAGYGFAVPSNIVAKVIEDLMEFGTVQRGVLGIIIKTVDSKLVKDKNLNVSEGVFVDSLLIESAALQSGIQKGDVVVEVNGIDIRTSQELQGIVAQHRPGETIDVLVNRNGQEKLIKVELKNREGVTEKLSLEEGKILKLMGVRLKELNKNVLKELDIENGLEVDKIFSGKIRKQTNMREGFIITHVNGERVSSISQVFNKIKNKDGGVMLEGIYQDIPGVYYYAFGL